LALVFGIVSALAVGVLAWMAITSGADRLRSQAESELRTQVAQLIGQLDPTHPPQDQYDVWLFDTESQNPIALGQTDVEPPFRTVVQEADDAAGSAIDRFGQAGKPYLVMAQRVLRTPFVVVAVDDVSATDRGVTHMRWRIGLAAASVVAVTSCMAYLLSGWALAPAKRTAEQHRTFLANAAHELRTPIAVIQAAASQAVARDRPPEQYVSALSEIRLAAERAGASVAEMLDLARLEAGQAPLRRVPLRLDLLAEEVVASQPSGPVVEVTAAAPVVVDADHSLLRQALDNAVRNATQRATHVTVSVGVEGRDAFVDVGDDGPGFDPAVLPHAFDRFRGDSAAGSGLGLAIARAVLEAHGGRAEAANRSGGGALIRLVLPFPKHPPT
jgi:signal transduction histidine kinase